MLAVPLSTKDGGAQQIVDVLAGSDQWSLAMSVDQSVIATFVSLSLCVLSGCNSSALPPDGSVGVVDAATNDGAIVDATTNGSDALVSKDGGTLSDQGSADAAPLVKCSTPLKMDNVPAGCPAVMTPPSGRDGCGHPKPLDGANTMKDRIDGCVIQTGLQGGGDVQRVLYVDELYRVRAIGATTPSAQVRLNIEYDGKTTKRLYAVYLLESFAGADYRFFTFKYESKNGKLIETIQTYDGCPKQIGLKPSGNLKESYVNTYKGTVPSLINLVSSSTPTGDYAYVEIKNDNWQKTVRIDFTDAVTHTKTTLLNLQMTTLNGGRVVGYYGNAHGVQPASFDDLGEPNITEAMGLKTWTYSVEHRGCNAADPQGGTGTCAGPVFDVAVTDANLSVFTTPKDACGNAYLSTAEVGFCGGALNGFCVDLIQRQTRGNDPLYGAFAGIPTRL